jgi:hypothetical protein
MSKTANQLEEIGNTNPFKVPEGYFEGLTGRIMSGLPEKVSEESRKVSLWERVQPWIYMAAMFIGIALMVNLFVRSPQSSAAAGLNLTSSTDMEEFYQYYEDQSLNNMYHEAIYFDVE